MQPEKKVFLFDFTLFTFFTEPD